jgi:hypothetical protein
MPNSFDRKRVSVLIRLLIIDLLVNVYLKSKSHRENKDKSVDNIQAIKPCGVVCYNFI